MGDGPQRAQLKARYPDVVFAGVKKGEELRRYYAGSDVFVFPSKSDTFGLVMLEALACGTPVAAYPVTGPLDVIQGPDAGVLGDDLGAAARAALSIPRAGCVAYAQHFTWARCAEIFARTLVPISAA